MYYNKKSIIYHNKEFVKPENTLLPLYGQTLHYGNGVFEGIRAYNTPTGVSVFKIKEHYERLLYGAKVMDLNFHYSVDQLIQLTYELLGKNNFTNAYIRPIITVGANMALQTSQESILTILTWEWGKYMGDKLLRIKTSPFQRPNPKSCFVDAKVTGHYVNSILSTNDAKKAGYDEALLLDMHGFVDEGSGANLFMEKDGKLFTPLKGSIMPGITRSTIIDLCKEHQIYIEEKQITLEELKVADSAFFTGTAAEVVGLASLDEYLFPLNWNKSLGHKLSQLYKEEVLGIRNSILNV